MSKAISKQITFAVANSDGPAVPVINAKEFNTKYREWLARRGMPVRSFRSRFKTA